MAGENRSRTWERIHWGGLDLFVRMFPYLLIGGIALTAALTISIGNLELAMRGLETIGIPVVVASMVLIGGRHIGQYPHPGTYSRYSNSVVSRLAVRKQVTVSAFLVLFAVSVWLLTVGQYRPWTYFVVVSLIYAVVLFQILVRKFDPRVVLAEILAVMLNLIYGVTLKYSYYFGWTDIFGHMSLAKITYQTGYTVPESVSPTYASFPLYHILVSEATYFLGLDMKTVLFVITPIPYVVMVVLLYYMLATSFRDDRVPALVTVLYSANTIVLFYGSYMITRTMAFVGFGFLLYLMYKSANEETSTYIYLLVLMTIFTTTVHQVSMPQITALLLGLYICKKIVGLPRFLRLRTLSLIVFVFLSYWVLFAWDFVLLLYNIYTRPEQYDEVEVLALGSKSIERSPLVEFARRARYLVQNQLTVFYAILGIGTGLYEKHPKYVHTLLLYSLLTLGLFVPNPLRMIGQAMDLFRFDRFMLLVSPFVAIAMAVGVVSLFRQVNHSRSDAIRWAGTALVFVLVIAYVFASVSHPLVASDSEDLPWSDQRKHLTESEVEGFDFVLQTSDQQSIVHSDSTARRFYRFYNRLYPKQLESAVFLNASEISTYEGYTVFRNEKFREEGLEFATGAMMFPTAESKRVLDNELSTKNKVYSNRDVEIFYTNESSVQ